MRKPSSSIPKFLKLALLTSDIISILGAFWVMYSIRAGSGFASEMGQPEIWLITLAAVAVYYVFGAYDIEAVDSKWLRALRSFIALLLCVLITILFTFLLRLDSRGILGRGVLFGGATIFWIISNLYRAPLFQIFQNQRQNWRWLAIVDEGTESRLKADLSKNKTLGQFEFANPGQLEINTAPIHSDRQGIVLADVLSPRLARTLMEAKLSGLYIIDLTQLYERFWLKLPIFFLRDQWFIASEGFSITHHRTALRLKRLVDLSLSLFLLGITWPIMLLTYILIRLESPGPAFFRQVRTGREGTDFSIIKFRSMRADAEKNGAQWASKNDARVTRVGRFIRLTRIDELPQVINVLRGEMSFIGPRPERPEFNSKLEQQIPYYQLRHSVSPGITGWAQVNYPYGASVEDAIEKLQYDLYYIKNYSLLLDLKIVLKTIQVVFLGMGR